MIKWTVKRFIDPLLIRLGERIDWLREQQLNRRQYCAVLGDGVTLYPGATIVNNHRNPAAITVGENTLIAGQLLTFWDHGAIHIGQNCYIGDGTRIWSQSSVTIGSHCLIAHLVDIHDTNSHPIDWQERRVDGEARIRGSYKMPTQTKSAPVVIEDDVWIGFKASVMKGVRIGRGAIVASNAVVTKNVEPWTVVAGNPAKVVAHLNTFEAQGPE
jgi:acetyltransferase-like isoleucine patch superfamily enzyme